MHKNIIYFIGIILLVTYQSSVSENNLLPFLKKTDNYSPEKSICTFSIVAFDPASEELGIAVASRFFAVGSVVPWAKAGVGAVATQAFANTSFGWRGIELMESGCTPEESIKKLLECDNKPERRQVGLVNCRGESATHTGDQCNSWAGGRSGKNYAIQGNILTGELVISAMEDVFIGTEGTLAERLFAALSAGDREGGDSRGKQSAALLVVKEGAGYGGFSDRAIDIRVDDHENPFKELERLLNIAQMNYAWNEAWTLFTKEKYEEALTPMKRAAHLTPMNGEVLYDLAVIQLAVGDTTSALRALRDAVSINPNLRTQAIRDHDLISLRNHPVFNGLLDIQKK